jgi:polysaccharide pyruvyl transferase WcaK-like protein
MIAHSTHAATPPATERPSLLLLSAWNLYNIGDVAHTPGFLRLVQQHFPEARVTVLASRHSEEIGPYLEARFPDCEVLPMEFQAGIPLSPAMEAAFAGADLVVLNSGMTLSYGYYGLEWERYMPRIAAFLEARSLGVPYGIWAHSFDKVEPQADILYRDVFATASFVYTRDSQSLALLERRGVRCAEMGFCPDSAFSFDLRSTEQSAAFMREHNLQPRRFLAFIPRLDVHRFREDGRENVHAAQARELIARWVRRTGEPVAIMHEVKNGMEPAREQVYDLLPDDVRPHVVLQPEYWMPDACQEVYANARLVVSAEMHSVILGLAAGTPSLHPYFAQAGLKQWMMRDLGIEEWLFDQDAVPLDTISDAMLAVVAGYPQAVKRADEARRLARRIQGERMAVVRQAALTHAAQRAGRRDQHP